jgi:hypothetical protein
MVKTSKETKNYLFPALMPHLDEPFAHALDTVAHGMFGFHGMEAGI